MDKLLEIAETEMQELKQPYVGSHHLFLAYLKINNNSIITYEEFRDLVLKIIGSCYKKSERILYTPYMRNIKKSNMNEKEAIKYILTDDNSITYNILNNKKIDIEKLLNTI